MTETIKLLNVDDSFRNELIMTMNAAERGVLLSERSFSLKFDQDANIIAVNKISFDETVYRGLCYLTGSMNFLFELITSRMAENEYDRDRFEEFAVYRKKLVRLLLDLLMGLSAIYYAEDAKKVIEEIYRRKMQIRDVFLHSQI